LEEPLPDQPEPENRDQRRKEREMAKIRARRDLRVTYDLPPALRQRIKELAEEEGIPASQLVTLALLRFLKDYEQGEVPVGRYKQPSRSPRYDWNLKLPADLLSVMRKKRRAGG
jgi:hypothetical protein